MKKPSLPLRELLKRTQNLAARREKARAKRTAELAARVPGGGYEPCIVSFIDVLGFRDLLVTRHADDIRDLLLQLREFTMPDHGTSIRRVKDARLHSRAFAESVSDAIVRVRVFNTQYGDGAFFQELLDLLHVQVQCIQNGVVIRAGLAIGDAYVGLRGEGPVFGPAMVRAFEIESNEAIYPRIVIDDAAYHRFLSDAQLHNEDHDVDEEIDYVNSLLRIDADRKRFIDYLSASASEFDSLPDYFVFLESHAKLVREKLDAASNARVHDKFKWLASYHNAVIYEVIGDINSDSKLLMQFKQEYGFDPLPHLHAIIIHV